MIMSVTVNLPVAEPHVHNSPDSRLANPPSDCGTAQLLFLKMYLSGRPTRRLPGMAGGRPRMKDPAARELGYIFLFSTV